jgi:hypothetical protein
MREYIPKRIPEEAYKRTISVCRDRGRIKELTEASASRKKGASCYAKKLAEERITAYEKVMAEFHEGERHVIEQNIINRIPLSYIETPLSIASMKRIKSEFVKKLAKELGEI